MASSVCLSVCLSLETFVGEHDVAVGAVGISYVVVSFCSLACIRAFRFVGWVLVWSIGLMMPGSDDWADLRESEVIWPKLWVLEC